MDSGSSTDKERKERKGSSNRRRAQHPRNPLRKSASTDFRRQPQSSSQGSHRPGSHRPDPILINPPVQRAQQSQHQQQGVSQALPVPAPKDPSLTTLCLGGELVDVPGVLLGDEQLFRAVIDKRAFYSLSQGAREHLRRFLPQPITSRDEEQQVLNNAFTSDPNFCFGNPMAKLFRRIESGYFSSRHAADQVQLRDHRRVLYDHYIRHYYMNLLKRLLIGRQTALEAASNAAPSDRIHISGYELCSKRKVKKANDLQSRARIRAKKMIKACKSKVMESGSSSDDDLDDCSTQIALAPGAESSLYLREYSENDLDLHQPTQMKGVKELLREYRHLKEEEPDCPSLDISDITLEEVYERAGICFQSEKNFALSVHKKWISKEKPSRQSLDHLKAE